MPGSTISDNINLEIDKISEWLKLNKLSFNIKKTKFMLFSNPNKKMNIPSLKIDNIVLENVDEFVFLGITIDKHLNWNSHIRKITTKIRQTVGIMNKLKNFVPKEILKLIYNSLVLPRLSYGILAWGHKGNKLTTLQKRSVRIISNVKYNAHAEPLFKMLKLLQITDLYKQQTLKFYYKFVNKKLPCYFMEMKLKPAAEVHNHYTRNRNKLFHIRTQKHSTDNGIRHHIISTVNMTSDNILSKLSTHSLQGFNMYVKIKILEEYSSE